MADREALFVVYTDGACQNNGKEDAAAGVGVYIGKDDPRNVSMPLEKVPHTNNRAELWAIKLALDLIEEEKPIKAIIHTDSQYALKSLTLWIVNWKKKNWMNAKRKPVLNKDIITEIDTLLTRLKETITIEINYVPGHSGDVDGNYHADLLATQGVLKEMPPSSKRQRIE